MEDDKRSVEQELADLERGLSSELESLTRGVSEVRRAGTAREEEALRRAEMKRLEEKLEARTRELRALKKDRAAEELAAVERRLEERRRELAALEEAERDKRARDYSRRREEEARAAELERRIAEAAAAESEAIERERRIAEEVSLRVEQERERDRLRAESERVFAERDARAEAAAIKAEAEEAAAALRREAESAAAALREERERISKTLEDMRAALEAQAAASPAERIEPRREPADSGSLPQETPHPAEPPLEARITVPVSVPEPEPVVEPEPEPEPEAAVAPEPEAKPVEPEPEPAVEAAVEAAPEAEPEANAAASEPPAERTGPLVGADAVAALTAAAAPPEAAPAEAAVTAPAAEEVSAPPPEDAEEVKARLQKDAEARAKAEENEKPSRKELAERERRELEKKEREDHERKTGDVLRPKRSLSWVYEMPILVGFLMAVQHFSFPGDPAFLSVHPSPLWIPVMLFGLRYGLLAGIVTGGVSACLYAWGVQRVGEGYRLEDADFYLRPGLFVILGAGFGIVADNTGRKLAALNGRVVDLLARITGLQKQILAEQKVLRSVEQQVVSQMSSIVTLFHGSRELGTLERYELLPAMLNFFTQALQAEKASLYVPKDGKWVLFAESGWGEDEDYPRALESGEGVIGRAAAERRVISVKDLLSIEGFEKLRGYGVHDAIMAGPICDPEGAPIAVFAVQAMDFLRFNSASVNLLALLSEWGGESVEKCLRVEELKSRSLFDEEYSVQSVRYFEKQLEQEFRRSVRYALPFSLLLIKIEGEETMPVARRTTARRVVSRILREAARTTDDVTRSPLPEAPFAVLLNTCTREQAEEARERLSASFAKIEWSEKIRIGLGSYKPEMTAKEEIVEQARTQLS